MFDEILRKNAFLIFLNLKSELILTQSHLTFTSLKYRADFYSIGPVESRYQTFSFFGAFSEQRSSISNEIKADLIETLRTRGNPIK